MAFAQHAGGCARREGVRVERDPGPLEEIERSVQERAKDISLEMSGAGKDKLRALIADEVARWSLDHRRGLRPYDLSEPELVAERAYRNLAGYGPLEPLLEDDDVWEVMVNAPDQTLITSSSPIPRRLRSPSLIGRRCLLRGVDGLADRTPTSFSECLRASE
jgi:hypothetical protein